MEPNVYVSVYAFQVQEEEAERVAKQREAEEAKAKEVSDVTLQVKNSRDVTVLNGRCCY